MVKASRCQSVAPQYLTFRLHKAT
ncbi:hypothetical protein AZE42_05532, partial [Rhizopogon vesiculosus]